MNTLLVPILTHARLCAQTEFIYCALSLGSKLTLGLLLYMNVLRFSSFAEALNDTPMNQRLEDALMAAPSAPPTS